MKICVRWLDPLKNASVIVRFLSLKQIYKSGWCDERDGKADIMPPHFVCFYACLILNALVTEV